MASIVVFVGILILLVGLVFLWYWEKARFDTLPEAIKYTVGMWSENCMSLEEFKKVEVSGVNELHKQKFADENGDHYEVYIEVEGRRQIGMKVVKLIGSKYVRSETVFCKTVKIGKFIFPIG